MTDTPWWTDHHELHTTARYMAEEQGDDIGNLLDLLDKPWHFDDEHTKAVVWRDEEIARENLQWDQRMGANVGPTLTPGGVPSETALRAAKKAGLRWGTTDDGEPGWEPA